MNAEQMKNLRKEFPATSVGQLPKPYKSDSPKGACRECGGYHGLPAVHLDYVGHAVVTSRLLDVDPEWTWEPMGIDQQGLPAFSNGNLWIRLTILGVTRIGVGDGKSAKEAIGDAIRNAAMRFGVALDLWSKEELEGDHEASPRATAATSPSERQPEPAADPLTAARSRAWAAISALHPMWDEERRKSETVDAFKATNLTTQTATAEDWNSLAQMWEAEK